MAFSDDDSYCYKFVAESVNWHQAKAACEAEESRLASVHSAIENTFITLKLVSRSIAEGWTGLNDLNSEGSFEWVDSSPADFFHWASGGRSKL